MHHFTAFVSLVVFFVRIINCADSVDDAPLREKVKLHVQRVSFLNFPCGTPQPRAIDVKDLVNETTWAKIQNFKIVPRRTILYRCFGTATCNEKSRNSCLHDDSEYVSLIFGVVNLHNQMESLNITAENHISCSCQPHDDHPK